MTEAAPEASPTPKPKLTKTELTKERNAPITTSLKYTYTSVHFFQEVWRVRWMLVASFAIVLLRVYGVELGFISEDSPFLKTMYRPAIGAIGFIFAHIAYQQAFPFINMRDLLFRSLAIDEFEDLRGDSPARATAAAAFIGTAILRGAIYAAFVIGCIMAV